MLHTALFAPSRPLDVPLWLAPSGPKGFATAHEVGADGVVLTGVPADPVTAWDHVAARVAGTVLRHGEDHRTPRVVEAVGSVYASMLHAMADLDPAHLETVPGGKAWRDAMVESGLGLPHHLVVHEGHAITVTERDRVAVAEAGENLLRVGWTGDAASIRSRVEHAQTAGVTELIYRPAGSDIVGEMEAFIAAAR
jgi:5,10-methylenetetrahydromethanopterin reductase